MKVHATLADLYTTRLGICRLTRLLSSLSFRPSISSPLDAWGSILLTRNHSFFWYDITPPTLTP